MNMDKEIALYTVWLSLQTVSEAKRCRLVEELGSAAKVYRALPEMLLAGGISEKEITRLEYGSRLAEAEHICELCAEKDISILCYEDKRYPELLRNIPDPPIVLYYTGLLPDFDNILTIGVVGQRRATDSGLRNAEAISRDLSSAGVTVISGGAAGIDTAALKGALKGSTPAVAVFGCGVDVDYPKTNWQMFRKIRQTGCVISEYAPGTQPTKWSFPRRNRIISGLSKGVLVVEAPEKSGSLITANHAVEQGRDVFCIPGPARAEYCAGSNRLLKQGASLVEEASDVLTVYQSMYELQPVGGAADGCSASKFTTDEQPVNETQTGRSVPAKDDELILSFLRQDGVSIDEISAKSGINAGKVMSILTLLQIKGRVKALPGGLFAKY